MSFDIVHWTKSNKISYLGDAQPKIGSITETGNQTTLSVNSAASNTYGIQKSSTVDG